MERKGRIILVTMLAVLFLFSTVQAEAGWWDKGLREMWKKIEKIDKDLKKVKKRSYKNKTRSLNNKAKIRENRSDIKDLKKQVKKSNNRKWTKKAKKKRRGNKGNKSNYRWNKMKEQIKAEIMADESFKQQLKGETGEAGPMGPAGPERPRWCGGCNYSDGESDMLIEADFRNAFLFYSWFQDTNLTDADFRGANCRETSFIKAKVKGTKFDDADLTNANLAGADWTDVNLAKAKSVEGVEWVYRPVIGYDSRTRGYIYDNIVATCPDGTMADVNGDTCEGHLVPVTP